jgi:hypothetical protein
MKWTAPACTPVPGPFLLARKKSRHLHQSSAKRDARMSLARIAPGPSGIDIQCSGCHHIHLATAEADPMQSDAVRWLAGNDLKSPT